MFVRRIEAAGIFSFGVGDERLSVDLNEALTVIVGPNASGKTNLLRALEVVRTVVRFHDNRDPTRGALAQRIEGFVRLARNTSVPAHEVSQVRVSMVLGPSEQDVLLAFIQAVVFAALLDRQVVDDQTLADLEGWTAREVTADKLESLFRGALVVSHTGVPGTPWRLAYEFTHGEVPYVWHLDTPLPNRDDIVEPRSHESVAFNAYPPLGQRLHGPAWASRSGPPRVPEAPFAFDALLSTEVDAVKVQMAPSSLMHLPAPWRRFVQLTSGVLPADYLSIHQPLFSMCSVLSAVLARSLAYLGPSGTHAPETSLTGAVATDASSLLADRLFQLKNGDRSQQERFGSVQDLFAQLAEGRRLEVRRVDSRGADDEGPAAEIEVSPRDAADFSEAVRPLGLAGTGVEQALHLAEALVNGEAVLLLDEPATNLHPSWQRIVRTHLQRRQGQSVLVTHSPYLVPAETEGQLAAVVRFSAPEGVTLVRCLPSEDLEAREWVQRITKELAWSADARALLYASGVVLLEGETELGALPTWFAKSTPAAERGSPEDRNVAFYSVGGDHGFGAFVRYLDRFGVPWAIVCDGAAFHVSSHHIFQQVVDDGAHRTLPELLTETCQLSDSAVLDL